LEVENLSKEKILIVEDEKISAMDIQYTLERIGYKIVDVVDSGEDAIESAANNLPDLVLMDIILKGNIDGIDAAEMIRTKLDIPIIYLTAYADDVTLRLANATVPYGYLIKPFTELELYSTLEMALQKRKSECEPKGSKENIKQSYI
jgi:CheY-like chemotaxis protein